MFIDQKATTDQDVEDHMHQEEVTAFVTQTLYERVHGRKAVTSDEVQSPFVQRARRHELPVKVYSF